MAFVRYQKVRNRVLGVLAAIGATVGGIFGYQSMSDAGGRSDPVAVGAAGANWQDEESTLVPKASSSDERKAAVVSQKLNEQNPQQRKARDQSSPQLTKAERYETAMKFTSSNSRRASRAKDVLGSRNPWKLNLYDDNQDGQWDRAKLDTDRNEVDDEKWTFKNGYWEKENGRLVWSNNRWVAKSSLTNPTGNAASQKLARYRSAFKIANSRANASGKGKDVLGSSSPWKLNLYDDNRDGQWDRAKLDTDRNELEDEKWTFKKGRWEKDSGKLVWHKDNWASAAAVAKSSTPNTDLDRYRAAFKIANARASSTGKGKDVLGARSPWKLNLYDDNRDGQWDRAKLDTNRDDADDEKWTFKNSRWEKDNGSKIWIGGQWESAKALSSAVQNSSSPTVNRYLLAMKLANGRANSSGKGKDVLGSQSPWKLNLYDDDRDGQWDRAKLDTNRDDVDDEKWNFKNGRWEKDGGAAIWDGGKWISASK